MKLIKTDSGLMAEFTKLDGTIVTVKDGYVVIDKEKENWNVNDHVNTTNIQIERIKGINKNYSTQPGHEWLITVHGNRNQYKPWEVRGKIIATFGFSLEGVDRIEKTNSAIESFKEYSKNFVYSTDPETAFHENYNEGRLFIDGYNTHAQTHPWTDKDIVMAMRMASKFDGTVPKYSFTEILESLQVPDRLLLPAEEVEDYVGGSGSTSYPTFTHKLKSENGIIRIY